MALKIAGCGLSLLGTALVIYLVLIIDRATSALSVSAPNHGRDRHRRASRLIA